MNVLIACEFSAVVRNAFIERGHNAWSCDLLPTEGRQGNHFVGDVTRILAGNIPSDMGENAIDIRTGRTPLIIKWDLLIAHPPCTYLCNSGVRWMYNADGSPNYERKVAFRDAAHFFVQLKQAPIPHIAIENPIPHKYAKEWVGKYDQIIQPWQFGHGETKATCLWLKGLPPLKPSKIVAGRAPRVHHASPGPDRWKERSRTLPGIAKAMAEQWGRVA